MDIEVHPDAGALAASIARVLEGRLALIQAERRRPSVVLTGGTIATAAYESLSAEVVDWAQVDFFWGDERFVAEGDPDRNDGQAREAFLNRLSVPQHHIHAMPAAGELSPAEAADTYAASLPGTDFDVVLLGVGPDGHIASLFPGFAQLAERERDVVEVLDSPKPPPQRLSLTLPRLNRADSVWLLVAGAEKSEAVAQALGDGAIEDTPASGVRGRTETVWMLDAAASRSIAR